MDNINNSLSMETVVQWFLGKAKIENVQDITPKKLQKLMYYAYAWGLVFLNETQEELNNKLFEAEFQAWVHGPVIPKIYSQYRNFGYSPIALQDASMPKISDDVALDVLNQVWDVYSQYDANQLESLTHDEAPWRNARFGVTPLETSRTPLLDSDMFNYYGEQMAK